MVASANSAPDDLSGVHVVAVHGTLSSAVQWRKVAAELRARGAEVRALDLPGHGNRSDEVFTLERCSQIIAEELASAAPGAKKILVGHSLGGYIAMNYGLAHPGTLDALVLFGAQLNAGRKGRVFIPLLVRAAAGMSKLAYRLTERWLPRWPLARRVPWLRKYTGAWPVDDRRSDLAAAAFAMVALATPLDRIAGQQVPVVIARAKDDIWAIDHEEYQRELSARGVVTASFELDRGGHLVVFRQPECAADVIAEAVALTK